MNSINWEVMKVLENNRIESNVKEHITQEMDAITVPKGLKEELWNKVKPVHRKRKLYANVLPYIAAIACIAIFIPLVLSGLASDSKIS